MKPWKRARSPGEVGALPPGYPRPRSLGQGSPAPLIGVRFSARHWSTAIAVSAADSENLPHSESLKLISYRIRTWIRWPMSRRHANAQGEDEET